MKLFICLQRVHGDPERGAAAPLQGGVRGAVRAVPRAAHTRGRRDACVHAAGGAAAWRSGGWAHSPRHQAPDRQGVPAHAARPGLPARHGALQVPAPEAGAHQASRAGLRPPRLPLTRPVSFLPPFCRAATATANPTPLQTIYYYCK